MEKSHKHQELKKLSIKQDTKITCINTQITTITRINTQIIAFKKLMLEPDIILINSATLAILQAGAGLVDIDNSGRHSIFGLTVIVDNKTIEDFTICCSYNKIN